MISTSRSSSWPRWSGSMTPSPDKTGSFDPSGSCCGNAVHSASRSDLPGNYSSPQTAVFPLFLSRFHEPTAYSLTCIKAGGGLPWLDVYVVVANGTGRTVQIHVRATRGRCAMTGRKKREDYSHQPRRDRMDAERVSDPYRARGK